MADAVNVVFPRKLVKEFITLYQNLPCLWDKHCISYKMKHKRHEAITKLTQLVQEYDPSATRVHVLRKIESLRACVRREHKRVQHSKEIAESEADIYTPHLWYYDLFSFMFQTDAMNEDYDKTKAHGSSPQPDAEDSETDDLEDEALPDDHDDDNYSSAAFSIASNMVEVPESTSGAAQTSSKRFLDEDKTKRHCTEVDDEYDAIGVNVAAKLRNLPGNMRILAEKLINDVLYKAQTNGLTNTTFINTPLDERDSEPDDPEDEALPDDDDASTVAIDDNYSSAGFSIASNMVEVPESISGAAQTSSKRFLDEDKNKRHCTEVDDEYDAIGVNVAAKLRNLPGNMRILAEKLINDVLYQAQTNGLTNATFINTPDPFK